jgi:hypothetical protein
MKKHRKSVSLLLIIGAWALGGVWWRWECAVTEGLQRQLAILRRDAAEQKRLQQEHDQLVALQPTAGELDQLRRKIEAEGRPAPEVNHSVTVTADSPSLRRGVWAAPSSWKDCGQSTPEGTLETTLWAAAGGDLGTLKNVFEFDAAALAKAQAILDGMPEVSRALYSTPEDLLTLLAAREIPLTDAQWFARTDHDADTVTESVVLRDAEGDTQQAHLTFHRGQYGWRLTIPAAIVERMTNALAGLPPSSSLGAKKPDLPPPQGPDPKTAGK